MCGLAGATASGEQPRVHAALNALVHRGPDGEGCWSDPAGGVTLGVRRLITTDPGAAANQPLISPDGRFVLAFNGYIAGHRRRILSLREKGSVVESDSDAALVLAVLGNALRDGCDPAKPLADLSGQYAFALWDCALRQLWLGRDPIGIKPLYFSEYGSGMWRLRPRSQPCVASYRPCRTGVFSALSCPSVCACTGDGLCRYPAVKAGRTDLLAEWQDRWPDDPASHLPPT